MKKLIYPLCHIALVLSEELIYPLCHMALVLSEETEYLSFHIRISTGVYNSVSFIGSNSILELSFCLSILSPVSSLAQS